MSQQLPTKLVPPVLRPKCLFLGTFADKPYLPYLKGLFNGCETFIVTEPVELLTHLEMYCTKRGITKVVSTNTAILAKLIDLIGNTGSKPSLSNYAGSLFQYKTLEIVFIDPIAQLMTVSYGRFITERYISKVTNVSSWSESSDFVWELANERNFEELYAEFCRAYAIATDIETFKNPLSIRCIGYTGIFVNASTGTFTTKSIVFPIDSEYNLLWMRKFNQIPVPKIFQNGKYDVSYLLRYNAVVVKWFWDTKNLMHSWYSELPKDLAFLNAFFLRKVVYWKDLAETNDLYEYYRYNALDTWATANVWIQQMVQLPDWAKRNYLLEFPLSYPCLLAEMTGLQRDPERLLESRGELDGIIKPELASLQKSIGVPDFNPGSPKQTVKLLHMLGCKDLESSNEKDIAKAILRHPLNARILTKVLNLRGWKKLTSTYLRTGDDAKKDGEGGFKEYKGAILYALNPDGTDTGRLASREHHFWCGLQIQNIPTRDGPAVKRTFKSPEGFYLAECDLEQAETRDTGHIAGDEKLIAAVSGTRDFHSINASAFFGLPYDSIYDDIRRKTKNKKLRDLAKRVNHGANYNMGPLVLIDTMGIDKIWEAKELLKLPYNNPKEIAQYLLDTFHRTYPQIKGAYYVSVVNEIAISRRLTSRAYHHTEYNLRTYKAADYIREGDWTRHCFGKPDKNKLDLNAYVAHCPQSLNARTLNEAFMKVFYEVALPNPTTFRLHAQIHDSILFSYKDGYESHAERVRECLEIPVSVRDVSGVTRTFTVPAALKLGKKDETTGEFKRAKYWDETE